MLSFKPVNIITSISILAMLLGYRFYNFPLWLVFVVAILWLLLTIMGSSFIGWNYHFKSLNSNPKITKNQIAITFDDGPNPEITPKVLSLLKKYNAKATFFCIGKQIELYPNIFKNIINDGHVVGNHTYSHDTNFGFFSTEKVLSELQQTNAIIKERTGLEIQFYRPAFGVTNPRIKRALKRIKLLSIGWNKRSLDTTNFSKKMVLKRVTNNLKKGDVILLHDNSEKTLAVLEQLLLFLQQQNMESVSIDTLFNCKAYA